MRCAGSRMGDTSGGSQEPDGLINGINLFRMAWNNPLKFIDSNGLKPDEPEASDMIYSRKIKNTIQSSLKVVDHAIEEITKNGVKVTQDVTLFFSMLPNPAELTGQLICEKFECECQILTQTTWVLYLQKDSTNMAKIDMGKFNR